MINVTQKRISVELDRRMTYVFVGQAFSRTHVTVTLLAKDKYYYCSALIIATFTTMTLTRTTIADFMINCIFYRADPESIARCLQSAGMTEHRQQSASSLSKLSLSLFKLIVLSVGRQWRTFSWLPALFSGLI